LANEREGAIRHGSRQGEVAPSDRVATTMTRLHQPAKGYGIGDREPHYPRARTAIKALHTVPQTASPLYTTPAPTDNDPACEKPTCARHSLPRRQDALAVARLYSQAVLIV
jgi:hypothetical protein